MLDNARTVDGNNNDTDTAATRPFLQSSALLSTAARLTPGGVHSNVRLTERPFPLFFASADGAHLRDADGNVYIDYVLGMGPMLLGHRPQPVIDAVVAQLGRGILYAGQHELEIAAAQRLADLIPCAEMLRFNVTGTEAVQSAIRLARAATGRQKIVKFQGHYDGWADSVLVNVARRGDGLAGGRLATVSETLGAEHAVLTDVLVAEWNDVAAIEALFGTQGDEVAAVVMEPVMANSGVILPADGYLSRVRELCTHHGVVLIFDEVITGFRIAPGGAQQRFDVIPDLATFGKAIASGFPVACVAGRRELFDRIEDEQITHAGTFNSNPVGMAATVATLDRLSNPEADVYAALERQGTRLMSGLTQVASDHPTNVLLQGLPTLFSVAFTERPVIRDHAEAAEADRTALRRFLPYLLQQGVRIAAKGTWFLSYAHNDADIDQTVTRFDRALTAFEAS